MTDSDLNILESSLSCCSKCKGLFKTLKDDNDKHWITCSGNPFKSPTNYFACERKIFLQLFQPEDFQLDGSFNLQNISKDDSFLNQVVKVRLPQETIDPFMFLRNYTSTGPATLQESDLDLLDQNIPDLEPGVEKDGPFVQDEKTRFGTNVEEDQIQKIINKNIDFLKHDEIHELHAGSAKVPFTESPPESRLLSPIEKHLNFLTDGTKSGLQSPFDKTESFLPDAAVPYQGDSIEFTSVQPVPFSCRLSTDLLGDLSASQDGNQSFQHLDLQKKDPFLGQNPGLAQMNSKDPFLINASVRSDKVSLTEHKYIPPSTRNVFDTQTSPTFHLQDGNYFNFPSTLDEPTQLDYLDLATIDFITNPSFIYGHDKNVVNNSETSNKQEQTSTSRTIDSFEKPTIFPTETRDDSAVDRKMKRLKIKKVKNRLPKKTKSSASTENTNLSSRLTDGSPRARRHSSRETEKAVMKITQSKKLIGQSNEAPENSSYGPKISSRKRKLSLPSTLEVGPLEGQAKLKSERKSSKSRSHYAGEIFNIKDTLTGFTEEEKDSFKAVLGRNTCVLVKKQKLMPNFRPPIIKQVNDMMDAFYNKPVEKDIEIIVDDECTKHTKSGHLGSAKPIDPGQTVLNVQSDQSQNLLPLEDFLNVEIVADDENYPLEDNSFQNTNNKVLSNHTSLNYNSAELDKVNGRSRDHSPRKHFMFTCSVCEFTCASVSALTEHVKMHNSTEDAKNECYLATKHNTLNDEVEEEIDVEDLDGQDEDDKNHIECKTFDGHEKEINNMTIIDNCSKNLESVSTINCTKEASGLTTDSANEVFYAVPLILDGQGMTIPDLNVNLQLENQLNLSHLNNSQLYATELSIDQGLDKVNDIADYNFSSHKSETFVNQNMPKQVTAVEINNKCHYDTQKCLEISNASKDLEGLGEELRKENFDVTEPQECFTHETEKAIPNIHEKPISKCKTDLTKTIPLHIHKNQSNSVIKSISVLKIKEINSISEKDSKNSYKLVNLKVVSQGQMNSHNTQKTPKLIDVVNSSKNVEIINKRVKKVKPEMFDKETFTDPEICKPEELEGFNNVNTDDSEQEIDVETLEDEDKERKDQERETSSDEIQHTDSTDLHLVEHAYSHATVDDEKQELALCNSTVKTQASKNEERRSLKAIVLRKRTVDSGHPHLYMCDQCSFGCEKKPSLKTHQEKCHGDYVYCPVPDCEFKTLYKRNLALHKMKHEGVKRYLCDKCPYSTSDATCLSSHQKHNHSDAVRFKCTDCDFAAILRLEILRHYRNIHLQQKIYACNQCDYRTGYTYLLKSHLMAHAGIRPYRCSLCDYQVCSANKVNWHIKNVHYGQKDAKCIKLDLTFEIDAKQFKCAEPTNEKDIKVIELTDEEVKIYVEKRRKEAEIKKAEKEKKEKLKLQKLQDKNKSELQKKNVKKNSQSKDKDMKMVSILGDIMDMKKIQSEASV